MQIDAVKVFQPYGKQAEFLTSNNRFRLFLGGVGSGKSWSLTLWVVMQLLRNPSVAGALLGRTTIDLNTVLLPELFGHLQRLRDYTGIEFIKDHNKGQGYVDLINGARCWFRPYNRIGKIRGLTLGWGAADEIEWSEADPEEIWSVLTGRLRAHCPHPGLAFATSPNGMRGITKRFVDAQMRYRDAFTKNDFDAMSSAALFWITVATSYDNPALPDHYFEALRSMSRRRYRQEVLGEVLRPTQSVFSIESHHVVPHDWRRHRNLPWILCIDWGGERHNVAIAVQVLPDGQWIVCHEVLNDDTTQQHWRRDVERFVNEIGLETMALCASDRAVTAQNRWLRGWLGPRGVQVKTMDSKHEQDVRAGIEMMRDMLDPVDGPPRLTFASTLSETFSGETAPVLPAVRGYCYMVDRDGNPTQKPRKDNIHDHAVDALRYGVRASARLPWLHGGRALLQVGLPSSDRGHGGSQ